MAIRLPLGASDFAQLRVLPFAGALVLSCLFVPSAAATPVAATGYTLREYASGFSLPLGIAVDADGVVWVSDSTAGTISTIVSGVPSVIATGVSCPRSMVFVDAGDWTGGLYTLGAPVDDCPDGTEVLSMVDPATGAATLVWETPDPGDHHWPFDLAWSDDAAYGGYLYLVDSAGPPDAAIVLHADTSYSTLTIPENLGSLAFGVGADWEGSLYAVLGSHGEATDSTLYAVSPTGGLTAVTPHGSFSAPGQMRFPSGTGGFAAGAYVSDSGVVERVDVDGTLTELVSGLTGANLGRGALAFDAAGDTLYLAEAGTGIIWAVTVSSTESAADADADGFATSDDCDDANAAVNPDAVEVCDGMDNDCDGLIDVADTDVTGTATQYEDADGDGWGNPATGREACEAHAGWVAIADDCDDGAAAVNPDAVEMCDGIDNDCDGLIDVADTDVTGTATQYEDADGDGWGNPATGREACEAHAGWVAVADDCDDTNSAVNPGAAEACGNGVDDDCEPATDDACPSDTGTPDTGTSDTGTPDTGTPDTGTSDTGTSDTGTGRDTGAGPVTVGADCGCAVGGAGAWPGVLFGFALLVGRRRGRPWGVLWPAY